MGYNLVAGDYLFEACGDILGLNVSLIRLEEAHVRFSSLLSLLVSFSLSIRSIRLKT